MDIEQKALHLIERTFPRIDEYRERFQTALAPAPGSALAADDLRGSPHQPLSEFARQSIVAAWDHLDLVRLTVEARRLFPTGTNSALRSALVASAQAVWLLGPDDPATRQQRGLTFAVEWYKRRIQFQRIYLKRLAGAEAEKCQAQLDMLREHEALAARLRTTSEELQPTSAVREAARRVLPREVQDDAELQWIRLGGDAHAIGWQLMLQETAWSTPGEEGIQEARVSGSLVRLAESYLAAWSFFEWATTRFDDLSSADPAGPLATESAECVHEMAREGCSYCGSASRRNVRDRTVYISPQQVGHLTGCSHKEDDDTSQWGEARFRGAWRDLCNGNPITADHGSQVGLVADRPCLTCVESDRN